MCMFDGSDGPAFSAVSEPRARVVHKCCECARAIQPGEQYERAVGMWDGIIDTYKTCHECRTIARPWLEENCNGWLYSVCLEDLEEHIDQFPNDTILMEAIWGMRSQWGRCDPHLYEALD